MLMRELLLDAVEQGHLRQIDVQFAMVVASDEEPAVMLAAALVSKDVGEGHVCLPLSRLDIDSTTPLSLQKCFSLLKTAIDWNEVLLSSQAVSTGETPTPLVLDSERLYLNRFWHNERTVAYFFEKENYSLNYNEENIKSVLDKFFEIDNEINWQKVAVAVALTRRISVISGGPGTGKTATVAKLLAVLVQLPGNEKCRIQLAAPTGKASIRLSELLSHTIEKLELTKLHLSSIPKDATTLHRLLGIDPRRRCPYFNENNPLHLDLLIIDEASMVDLTMMSRIINALPFSARVVFLGDRDQLASVGAGSVLGDICAYASTGYSLQRAKELEKLTGYKLAKNNNASVGSLQDSVCFLKKSYRFNNRSTIGKLAKAVNRGDYRAVRNLFSRGYKNIKKVSLNSKVSYLAMIDEAIQEYRLFLIKVDQRAHPRLVLSAFSKYKILCALHTGLLGVAGISEHIEKALIKKKKITWSDRSHWYEGRPIIILRNDDALGLSNGDIGVALNRGEGLRVWFHFSGNIVRSVHPNRLPEHETAWAMTIHKSQGSEFDHVAIIFPSQIGPLVTRELVYTAVTRSRYRLSMYVDDLVLAQAIARRTERRSGLVSMLKRFK